LQACCCWDISWLCFELRLLLLLLLLRLQLLLGRCHGGHLRLQGCGLSLELRSCCLHCLQRCGVLYRDSCGWLHCSDCSRCLRGRRSCCCCRCLHLEDGSQLRWWRQIAPRRLCAQLLLLQLRLQRRQQILWQQHWLLLRRCNRLLLSGKGAACWSLPSCCR
jgi:hypothetical protein